MKLLIECFNEHLDLFTFPKDISNYCESFYQDFINVANLATLNYTNIAHWKQFSCSIDHSI